MVLLALLQHGGYQKVRECMHRPHAYFHRFIHFPYHINKFVGDAHIKQFDSNTVPINKVKCLSKIYERTIQLFPTINRAIDDRFQNKNAVSCTPIFSKTELTIRQMF